MKPIPPRPAANTRPRSPRKAGEWAWHYRTLLALRDHLRGGVGDRLRESSPAMEPPSLHPEDLSDERYDRELMGSLPADPAEALREIEHALQRIQRKAYGRCETTGRLIPKAQLREQPWRRRAHSVVPVPDPSSSIRQRATVIPKPTQHRPAGKKSG